MYQLISSTEHLFFSFLSYFFIHQLDFFCLLTCLSLVVAVLYLLLPSILFRSFFFELVRILRMLATVNYYYHYLFTDLFIFFHLFIYLFIYKLYLFQFGIKNDSPYLQQILLIKAKWKNIDNFRARLQETRSELKPV